MGLSRNLAMGVAAGALLLALFVLMFLQAAEAEATLQPASGASYVGVASCAGST